ncbi:MAG: T9SS type A sorting domain-containing protein [Bacteroidetes bacterium]|nr:T9SS type A sorting domain-containing protein [Bacteroidota bacterium]
MKNKVERNHAISSKNGYPQFILVFWFILLLAFFSAGNMKAQCGGKSLVITKTDASCKGSSNGTATVTMAGGVPGFTYSWSKGGISVTTSTTSTITNLTAGTYTVLVQDEQVPTPCQLLTTVTITEPPAVAVAAVSTPALCKGESNGTASATVNGGVGGYSYLWFPSGNTTSSITGLTMGVYTVTVSDGNGCTSTTAIAVTEPPALTGSAGVRLNVSCYGGNNGEATVSGSGGTKPYTFNWSNGATGDTARSLVAGCYTITVTDAMGCSKQLFGAAAPCITQPPVLEVTFMATQVICNGGNDGSVTVAGNGGTYPHTYSWNTGQVTPTLINLLVGTYTCTVTDANACFKTAMVTITQPPVLVITSVPVVYPSCGKNNGTATANVSGGAPPYLYSWFGTAGTATGQIGTGFGKGNDTVRVTDSYGCIAQKINLVFDDSCHLVWPGDANRDLVADNNDMLAIGIGYGSTYSIRPNATINWTGQAAWDWSNALNNGTNYKHIDCNGDAKIDYKDTSAIIQNYGLTHALKLVQPEYINGLPDLTFKIPNDTTLSGSTIKVPIMLGTSTNQATGVYGLAFSITYDPKIVDTTKLSLSLNGSWLGTNGTDLIYITKNFGKMGRMDVGITRIDHQNVSGFGKIGDLNIYMRDDISGKIASTLYKKLMLQAVQVKAISKDESIIQLNAGKDSIIVKQDVTTGLNKYSISNGIKVYPNPASGSFTVDVNSGDVKEMKLVNIIGETVWQKNNTTESRIMVDTQTLSGGTYYLAIITSQERIVKQVNIVK